MTSRNGEESLSPGTDDLRGGLSHGYNTPRVKNIGGMIFELHGEGNRTPASSFQHNNPSHRLQPSSCGRLNTYAF